jgi:hypothetical protein
MKIFIIDTNIILNDSNNVEILSGQGENLIIIPETVLDEVDAKKSGFDEINFQARAFGRVIQEIEVKETLQFPEKGIKIISTELKRGDFKISIYIPSKERYSHKDSSQQNIINDKKILEITKDVEEILENRVTLITLDIMMRTRAISLGIDTETLFLDKNLETLEFLKEIEVDDAELENLDHTPILDLDPNYKIENFSYKFTHLNGKTVLGVIQNGRVKVLDENELRKQTIKPRNLEQLFFSNALFDSFYDVVISNAKAGCSMAGSSVEIEPIPEWIDKNELSKILDISKLDLYLENGFLKERDSKFDKNSIRYHLLNLESKHLEILKLDSEFDSKYLKFEYWLGFKDLETALDRVLYLRKKREIFETESSEFFEIRSRLINGERFETHIPEVKTQKRCEELISELGVSGKRDFIIAREKIYRYDFAIPEKKILYLCRGKEGKEIGEKHGFEVRFLN